MIGLTTFQLFPVPPHNPPFHNWFRHDYDLWIKMSSDSLEEYDGNTANLVEFFASGIFPLYQGRTERISMSLLHAYDPVEGLNSSDHSSPALYVQKQIVQAIYETDYRFAQPPEMPTLKAIPYDGKVVLTWDDRADTKTHDPFVRYQNDFEGYKLFRSTDLYFSDATQITDGFGTANILKPIFQCDKIDEYTGFADWGEVNGQGLYLGNNSGIRHYFVDENVQNGRTYYYGLTAYDYGIPEFGENGISPSENNLVIDLDEYGDIRGLGKNIAIAVPHPKASGYVQPQIQLLNTDNQSIRGTDFEIDVLDWELFSSDKSFKVKFDFDTTGYFQDVEPYRNPYDFSYSTNKLFVYELVGDKEELLYEETPDKYAMTNIVEEEGNLIFNPQGFSTEVFSGIQLSFNPFYDSISVDFEKTGWLVGDSDINVEVNNDMIQFFPWTYDIIFTGDEKYQSKTGIRFGITDINNNTLTSNDIIFEQEFDFCVVNRSFVDSNGVSDTLDLLVHDINKNGIYDIEEDNVIVGTYVAQGIRYRWTGTLFHIDFNPAAVENPPRRDDVYRLQFIRPFGVNDSLEFKVNAEIPLVSSNIKSEMEKIQVVPNPYVAGNTMEPAVTIINNEQQRRLMFTHIPANCRIKIFTVSGVLVDEIIVEQEPSNGIVHWDLLSSENLDIAAGMYIYHVKSDVTSDEKIGKFAVIK
jgi:hypothetical protein